MADNSDNVVSVTVSLIMYEVAVLFIIYWLCDEEVQRHAHGQDIRNNNWKANLLMCIIVLLLFSSDYEILFILGIVQAVRNSM